jgi:hypothetical protein
MVKASNHQNRTQYSNWPFGYCAIQKQELKVVWLVKWFRFWGPGIGCWSKLGGQACFILSDHTTCDDTVKLSEFRQSNFSK